MLNRAGKRILCWREPRAFRRLHRIKGRGRSLSALLGIVFLLIYVTVISVLLLEMFFLPIGDFPERSLLWLPPLAAAVGTVFTLLWELLRPAYICYGERRIYRRARGFDYSWDITWIGGWDVVEKETAVGQLRMLVLTHKTDGYLFFGLPKKMTEERLAEAFAVHGIVRERYKIDPNRYFYPSSNPRRAWK